MTDNGTSGQSVQKSPKLTEGLFLMDGIEGLRSLPRHSVDMLLTDPPYGTTRTGYRSTARVTNRALQERLSAAAADGYNMAVEKLIARAEALRPKPIREQMTNAAKEAAKENATRPAQAKGKEARDDR